MKIQSNSHGVHSYGQMKRQQQASGEETAPAKFAKSDVSATSTQASSTEQQNIGKTEGVIRNLQEGHYHSVAQLRLSIVHAERFQQATSQATAGVFAAEGEQLTTAVKDKMASLSAALNNTEETGGSTETLASLDLEGAMMAFEEAVKSGANSSEGEQPSIETFRDLYSTAFQALVDKLYPVDSQSVNDNAATVQSVTGEEVEGEATTDESGEGATVEAVTTDAEEEQAGISTELAALQEWFNETLNTSVEAIQNQIDTISAPPLPSQPSGNGAAYEKFLAVYKELYGATAQQPDLNSSVETGAIETEA